MGEQMIYIVTAHRWGWLNAPMYHVWAGEDRAKAEKLAQEEAAGRGDKYGCQVVQCIETDEAMRFEPVAYFSSAYGEKAPYHNPYIEMYEALGQLVTDAVRRGQITIPDPANPGFMTTETVKIPEWLMKEANRRLADAEIQAAAEQGANDTG
jgi:hypothetical protein